MASPELLRRLVDERLEAERAQVEVQGFGCGATFADAVAEERIRTNAKGAVRKLEDVEEDRRSEFEAVVGVSPDGAIEHLAVPKAKNAATSEKAGRKTPTDVLARRGRALVRANLARWIESGQCAQEHVEASLTTELGRLAAGERCALGRDETPDRSDDEPRTMRAAYATALKVDEEQTLARVGRALRFDFAAARLCVEHLEGVGRPALGRWVYEVTGDAEAEGVIRELDAQDAVKAVVLAHQGRLTELERLVPPDRARRLVPALSAAPIPGYAPAA